MTVHVLAQIRVAEGWSAANILGALILAAAAVVAVVVAVRVTLRR